MQAAIVTLAKALAQVITAANPDRWDRETSGLIHALATYVLKYQEPAP